MNRTSWLVTPDITYGADRWGTHTPGAALQSLERLVGAFADTITRRAAWASGGTVLITDAVVKRLGLADDAGTASALAAVQAAGWSHSRPGAWQAIYAKGRPTINIGRISQIEHAARQDPLSWPFWSRWPGDTVEALQAWHRLTGIPWANGPAVQGLELIHATLRPYRVRTRDGWTPQRQPVKRDESTPAGACETMWGRLLWSRPDKGHWLHGYDRRRAGRVACTSAKLCPASLKIRHIRRYDPRCAGWWQITVPPWNVPQMPHPAGPVEVWSRAWVTTATMDLLTELAREGVIDTPEIISAYVGVARPVLAGLQEVAERTYQAPATGAYDEDDHRPLVQAAIKEACTRGIGMLAKEDGQSSILRPDWFHGVNATKRANTWRVAWKIGRNEDRWPTHFEDDAVFYASDDPDPVTAAPKTTVINQKGEIVRVLELELDIPGAYRVESTRQVSI